MLSGPQTLLNIAEYEVSLWHDRIPSHSSVLIGSQMVKEHLSSREDGKIDTLLLRTNTFLTQLKVRPGSCPLRIVDMWIGRLLPT